MSPVHSFSLFLFPEDIESPLYGGLRSSVLPTSTVWTLRKYLFSMYTMSAFIARSHLLQYDVCRVGYAVVSLAEVSEAKFLLGKPLHSWLKGLIALTRAFFSSVKTKESLLELILSMPSWSAMPMLPFGWKGVY